MKKIIIIAGPNGAAKTTFAREFLPNEAACPVVIQRRFDAGVANCLHLYRSRVNRWHLYDNTGQTPVLMATGENS